MNILLSPHSDDECLFASYIIQKYNPLVIICSDDYRKDGLVLIRRNESKKAMDILGADLWFLGVPSNHNDDVFAKLLKIKLQRLDNVDTVFAPNPITSNEQHKIVSVVAKKVFGKVTYYDTYNNAWGTSGRGKRIEYTEEMNNKKEKAMNCYESQIRYLDTKGHFGKIWDEFIEVSK